MNTIKRIDLNEIDYNKAMNRISDEIELQQGIISDCAGDRPQIYLRQCILRSLNKAENSIEVTTDTNEYMSWCKDGITADLDSRFGINASDSKNVINDNLTDIFDAFYTDAVKILGLTKKQTERLQKLINTTIEA